MREVDLGLLTLIRQLLEAETSAVEMRQMLSEIDPSLLDYLNNLPRGNIRAFTTTIVSRFNLHPPAIEFGCGYRSSKPEVLLRPYIGFDHTGVFDHPIDKFNGPDLLADATCVPIMSSTISTALCLELLEHVKDDRAVLSEANRVVVPLGHLIITLPGKDIPKHEKLPYQRDFRRYSLDGVRKLIEDSGFRLLLLEDKSHFGFQTNIFAVGQKIAPLCM